MKQGTTSKVDLRRRSQGTTSKADFYATSTPPQSSTSTAGVVQESKLKQHVEYYDHAQHHAVGHQPQLHQGQELLSPQSVSSGTTLALLARTVPLCVYLIFVLTYLGIYLLTYQFDAFPRLWFEYAILPCQFFVVFMLSTITVGAAMCLWKMDAWLKVDWERKLGEFVHSSKERKALQDGLLHAVIIPCYKEDCDLVSDTINNLVLKHDIKSQQMSEDLDKNHFTAGTMSKKLQEKNPEQQDENESQQLPCDDDHQIEALHHPVVALPMVLVLAMEEREGPAAVEKAERLKGRHGHQFAKIILSYHKENQFPGEVAGKSSNVQAAWLELQRFLNDPTQCEKLLPGREEKGQFGKTRTMMNLNNGSSVSSTYGSDGAPSSGPGAAENEQTSPTSSCSLLRWHPDRTFITNCDADTLFHRQYFPCVTFQALQEPASDRAWRFWQAVQEPLRNWDRVPGLSKVGAAGAWMYERYKLGLVSPSARPLMSSYTATHRLVERMGGFAPDVISEDLHTFLQGMLTRELWNLQGLHTSTSLEVEAPGDPEDHEHQHQVDHHLVNNPDEQDESSALIQHCGGVVGAPAPGGRRAPVAASAGVVASSSSTSAALCYNNDPTMLRFPLPAFKVVAIYLPFASFIVESEGSTSSSRMSAYFANVAARYTQSRRHLQGIGEVSFLVLNQLRLAGWQLRMLLSSTSRKSPTVRPPGVVSSTTSSWQLFKTSVLTHLLLIRIAWDRLVMDMLLGLCILMGMVPGAVAFLHTCGLPLLLQVLPLTSLALGFTFVLITMCYVSLLVYALKNTKEGKAFPVWQLEQKQLHQGILKSAAGEELQQTKEVADNVGTSASTTGKNNNVESNKSSGKNMMGQDRRSTAVEQRGGTERADAGEDEVEHSSSSCASFSGHPWGYLFCCGGVELEFVDHMETRIVLDRHHNPVLAGPPVLLALPPASPAGAAPYVGEQLAAAKDFYDNRSTMLPSTSASSASEAEQQDEKNQLREHKEEVEHNTSGLKNESPTFTACAFRKLTCLSTVVLSLSTLLNVAVWGQVFTVLMFVVPGTAAVFHTVFLGDQGFRYVVAAKPKNRKVEAQQEVEETIVQK
ncbi:unnamed protein product [Amoebophrya sp. A120]|nr:unnamed protein product [Amoebophrya sp. A120]|eukprot:GSA120T00000796001.1